MCQRRHQPPFSVCRTLLFSSAPLTGLEGSQVARAPHTGNSASPCKMGAPGLLARMFCFSADSRVRGEPRRRTARARAGEPSAAPPPSGSPTAAEALAAYLGRQPLTAPASLPPRDTSADESVPQSSTYTSALSSLDSGGSGGPALDPGYEADSDDDFQPPSEDNITSRGRRFCPAVRHYKAEADQERRLAAGPADAAGGSAMVQASGAVEAGAAGGAVGELIEQFERLSISSGSRCGSPASAGVVEDSEQELPTVPAVRAQAARPWLGTSTCTAEVHVHPSAGMPSLASASGDSRPGTAGPLPAAAGAAAAAGATAAHAAAPPGSKSVSRCSSATSLAASGSISLAHFLGGDSAAGSSRSNSFKIRRMGSTQVVVADPDSPAAHSARSPSGCSVAEGVPDATPGPSAAATPSKPPLLPKSNSGSSTSSGGSGGGRGSGRAPHLPLVVQQRLNEIQSGHYITFEKLRSHCGNFQGEIRLGVESLREAQLEGSSAACTLCPRQGQRLAKCARPVPPTSKPLSHSFKVCGCSRPHPCPHYCPPPPPPHPVQSRPATC